MMEAPAIGLRLLAGYSVAATVAALYWWRTSEGWRRAAWEATMTTEDWVQKSWDLEDELEAMEGYLAPFDHDGNGKPGGSKPRGKG